MTEQNKISPISDIDRRIIEKAISIAYDQGCGDLADILSTWKSISSDSEVLEQLEELLLQGGVARQEYNSSGGFTKFMVNIGSKETFELFKLSRITMEDFWDKEKGKYRYDIVVNKDSTASSFYANTRVSFWSKTERDNTWNRLQRDLAKYSSVEFI